MEEGAGGTCGVGGGGGAVGATCAVGGIGAGVGGLWALAVWRRLIAESNRFQLFGWIHVSSPIRHGSKTAHTWGHVVCCSAVP